MKTSKASDTQRRGSAVVRTSAWHAVVLGSIPGPGMLYFCCKNLALDIRDCVSLVGRGSSVVGAPLRNLGKFVYPTLPASFGRDTNPLFPYIWCLCQGEVKDPTPGVNV